MNQLSRTPRWPLGLDILERTLLQPILLTSPQPQFTLLYTGPITKITDTEHTNNSELTPLTCLVPPDMHRENTKKHYQLPQFFAVGMYVWQQTGPLMPKKAVCSHVCCLIHLYVQNEKEFFSFADDKDSCGWNTLPPIHSSFSTTRTAQKIIPRHIQQYIAG